MGPPRSSKKRPQANRAHCRVKEILALRQHMMGLEEIVESLSSTHPNYAEKSQNPLRTADTTAYFSG
jgi:hypothetical protein